VFNLWDGFRCDLKVEDVAGVNGEAWAAEARGKPSDYTSTLSSARLITVDIRFIKSPSCTVRYWPVISATTPRTWPFGGDLRVTRTVEPMNSAAMVLCSLIFSLVYISQSRRRELL